MVTITIAGYGTYEISSEKLQELLSWLSRNSGVRTQTNEQTRIPVQFQGKDLING
jgi:hypothetical protein